MTKCESAYQKIRKAIVYGELQPGERLIERQIIAKFNIGKTPVREAIRQLQSEGLVDALPNKGAVVKRISVQEMEEAYDVASLLEAHAVELATNIIKTSEIETLKTLLESMIQAAEDREYSIYSEKNRKFHDTFHSLAGNSVLYEQIKMVRSRFYRFRGIIFSVPGFLKKTLTCMKKSWRRYQKKKGKRRGRL